jgi:phenylpropionate dioxygenase-like ring-hydroxylating dioxygenase large terminal subunit
VIQCPFHGWQWNHQGRNVCIPYQDRPNRGRRIHTYPVVERNESVYIWHDVEGRAPFFDVPDVFASFDDGTSAANYYPQVTMYRANLEMHPQYVLENGVDFAHFKYVHNTPIGRCSPDTNSTSRYLMSISPSPSKVTMVSQSRTLRVASKRSTAAWALR